MWSKHSRRIDPISRSAKPFCQGEAGAVGLSRMPMERNRLVTIQLEKEPAIIVREPDATMQPTPQDNQLMSKHRVLSFEP